MNASSDGWAAIITYIRNSRLSYTEAVRGTRFVLPVFGQNGGVSWSRETPFGNALQRELLYYFTFPAAQERCLRFRAVFLYAVLDNFAQGML